MVRSGKSHNENIVSVSFDTWFTGHFERRIRWWCSFSHFTQNQVRVWLRRSDFKNHYFLSKTCFFFKKVISLHVWHLEMPKNGVQKCDVINIIDFLLAAQSKIRISHRNLAYLLVVIRLITYFPFLDHLKIVCMGIHLWKIDIFNCSCQNPKFLQTCNSCFISHSVLHVSSFCFVDYYIILLFRSPRTFAISWRKSASHDVAKALFPFLNQYFPPKFYCRTSNEIPWVSCVDICSHF